MNVVCWGELLWDLLPDGPRLGGALANVAYHVAQLDATAILVSVVGDDELGHRAIAALRAAGVDTRFVRVDPTRATGTVSVTFDRGEPRYAIGALAAWDALTLDEELVSAVANADAIVYGTLAQRTPIARGALKDALAGARGLRVCDVNLRPPYDSADVLLEAIARADVVKLNAIEAERVARALAVPEATEALVARGLIVASTRGAAGATLAIGDRRLEHPGFAASGGDAVGAGDAFTAVLTVGLVRRAEPAALLARANAYAAFVASRAGAMPPIPRAIAAAALDRSA